MTYGVKLLVLLVFLAIRKLFIDRFRTLELFETVLFGKVCTRLRIFCVCQSRWIVDSDGNFYFIGQTRSGEP